jgi:hypothetical protein
MSMSTHVIGFKPPDEKWKRMKAIWDSCQIGNVNVPDEVMEFFDHEMPSDTGVRVELETGSSTSQGACAVKWSDPDRETDGYEVDVRKLPKDVTIIRFYNSW